MNRYFSFHYEVWEVDMEKSIWAEDFTFTFNHYGIDDVFLEGVVSVPTLTRFK